MGWTIQLWEHWPRAQPRAQPRLVLLGHPLGIGFWGWLSPGEPAGTAESGSSDSDCVGAEVATLPQFAPSLSRACCSTRLVALEQYLGDMTTFLPGQETPAPSQEGAMSQGGC